MKTRKILLSMLIVFGGFLFANSIQSSPSPIPAEEDKCVWELECPEPENDPNCGSCVNNCTYEDCSWMWCILELGSCEHDTDCACSDNPN